ncbi:DUF6415 family natural product biosynthesis protein [Streptomyces sp. NPDC099050]|uniref:DUF6415 family natural product biosynthesis protein n=1 Tax=Streptomyces sp. NPDC099050 TaxID=3366100 RepID=UPI0037FF31BF
MNPGERQTIEELAARALVPYAERPGADGVAQLVDDLMTEGQKLHAAVSRLPLARRTERAGAALAEWTYFAEAGPLSDGDHAAWNHARGLARILRILASVLHETQPSSLQ